MAGVGRDTSVGLLMTTISLTALELFLLTYHLVGPPINMIYVSYFVNWTHTCSNFVVKDFKNQLFNCSHSWLIRLNIYNLLLSDVNWEIKDNHAIQICQYPQYYQLCALGTN